MKLKFKDGTIIKVSDTKGLSKDEIVAEAKKVYKDFKDSKNVKDSIIIAELDAKKNSLLKEFEEKFRTFLMENDTYYGVEGITGNDLKEVIKNVFNQFAGSGDRNYTPLKDDKNDILKFEEILKEEIHNILTNKYPNVPNRVGNMERRMEIQIRDYTNEENSYSVSIYDLISSEGSKLEEVMVNVLCNTLSKVFEVKFIIEDDTNLGRYIHADFTPQKFAKIIGKSQPVEDSKINGDKEDEVINKCIDRYGVVELKPGVFAIDENTENNIVLDVIEELYPDIEAYSEDWDNVYGDLEQKVLKKLKENNIKIVDENE